MILISLLLGSPQAIGARLGKDLELIIQSPTRVQAGKLFQVNIRLSKSKLSGICWMPSNSSKGFKIPKDFKMKAGKASVELLPIQPGAGTITFYCGTERAVSWASGSTQIYIAP